MSAPRFSEALRKLRKLVSPREDMLPIVDRPSDLELPWSPGGENAIQDMLDGVGFPWRSSCQDLIDRFGLVRHTAYDWEQSPIVPCPLDLDGLLNPISPQILAVRFRDQVPMWFSGYIWIKNDPLANIRHAHRRIEKLLGSAPIGVRYNTISSTWHAGPARISLTVWPKKLQSSPLDIPAHKRDRRLKTACAVFIEPGYRRSMNEQEREWLKGFMSLAEVREGVTPITTLGALWANAPEGRSQELLREPPTDQDNFLNQIGMSADGAAVIVCARQLYIIPIEQIVAFSLQKIRPAKGGGGAYLSLVYNHSASPITERELGISGSFGEMDTLDDLASHLSRTLNRLLRIPEPQYDY